MRKPKKNGAKVQEIGGVAVAEAPAEPPPPPEPPAEPARRGRPPINPISKRLTFFERLGRIEKADWGARAKVKIYRLGPIIDRLRSSEFKYIGMYEEAIDEERIKHEHGSGRYRLYLNFKEPAGQEKELDSVEIDIMDLAFPPNVPPGDWVEDGKNKQWKWAKEMIEKNWAEKLKGPPPPPPPPAQAPTETLLEAARVVTDIQDKTRQSMMAAMPPAPAAAAPSADPFKTGMEFAREVLSMKAENPMSAYFEASLQTVRAELAAERAENRILMNKLLDARTDGNKGSSLEEMIEKADTLLPKVKELLNIGGEKLVETVQGRRRPWWQDLLMSTVPALAPALAPIGAAIARRMMMPAAGDPNPLIPAAAPNPAAAPAAGAQPAAVGAATDPLVQLRHTVAAFLGQNLRPMQNYFTAALEKKPSKYFDDDVTSGADFAVWVHESHGSEILNACRDLGAAQIVALFQAAPPLWAQLQPHEAALREFISDALAYKPDDPAADDKPAVID